MDRAWAIPCHAHADAPRPCHADLVCAHSTCAPTAASHLPCRLQGLGYQRAGRAGKGHTSQQQQQACSNGWHARQVGNKHTHTRTGVAAGLPRQCGRAHSKAAEPARESMGAEDERACRRMSSHTHASTLAPSCPWPRGCGWRALPGPPAHPLHALLAAAGGPPGWPPRGCLCVYVFTRVRVCTCVRV